MVKTELLWSDTVPEKDGVKSPINEVAFSMDGLKLAVGVGSRVLLYNTADGDLITSLKAHKDSVMSVDWSKDGKRLCSGGLDKQVVIWTSSGEGVLKYTHADAIFKVCYNPVTHQVASCTAVDVGLWSPDQKSVNKHKVSSKIVCVSWSSDGQQLALGLFDGKVSIRDKTGVEKYSLERPAPVFSLTWCPSKDQQPHEPHEALAVGSWDQSLTLYNLSSGSTGAAGGGPSTSSSKEGKRVALSFDPLCIRYVPEGEFLLVAGTEGSVVLFSKDGQKLTTLLQTQGCEREWVWSVGAMNSLSRLAIGTHHGTIAIYTVQAQSVCARYKDRYAFREHLTDVVVQHFTTEQKVRIKCRDLVSRVALYHHRLAVQLPDRVAIYELTGQQQAAAAGGEGGASSGGDYDMHYRTKDKIFKQFHAQHMGVLSQHLIVCKGRSVQLYTFKGVKEREWVLESDVSVLRVEGGPVGRECVLLGCVSGVVLRIVVCNVFPIPLPLPPTNGPVTHLDLSLYHKSLAVLDSEERLTVYSLKNHNVLFQESGVCCALFNSEVEDHLAFASSSSNGSNGSNGSSMTLSVKTSWASGFPIQQVKCACGSVLVGFRSSKLYTIRPNLYAQPSPLLPPLNNNNNNSNNKDKQNNAPAAGVGGGVRVEGRLLLKIIDIPLSQPLAKHVELGQWEEAYRVASLGVTEADWRLLALQSLRALQLDVSRLALTRLRDVKGLDLVHTLTTIKRQDRSVGGKGDELCVGEVLAYSGHYMEAAKTFARAGQAERAIALFSDLRQWEEAKVFANANGGAGVDMKDLARRQAEWAEETNDWQSAVDLYVAAGDPLRAVKLVGEHLKAQTQTPAPAAALSASLSGSSGGVGSGGGGKKDWRLQVLDIARCVAKHEKEILQECGKLLAQAGVSSGDGPVVGPSAATEGGGGPSSSSSSVMVLDSVAMAKEVFVKLEDFSSLMSLYMKRQKWDEAVKLADERQGQFDESIFLPYAHWLAQQDRFDESLEAYRRAGRPDLSATLVHTLAHSAVVEGRYKDASYYLWILAVERVHHLHNKVERGVVVSEKDRAEVLSQYKELSAKADLYYAFQFIHAYTKEPFTSEEPITLFQVARFLLNNLGAGEAPLGISKVDTLYTLAKQAQALGAYKLARFAFDRLQKLRLPSSWQDAIDLDMLTIQAKPVRDNPELLPVCYRCGATNPLLNPFNNRGGGPGTGDSCTTCLHPFIRSFIHFEVLPLVEFVPEGSIDEHEALDMLRTPPIQNNAQTGGRNKRGGGGWRERDHGGNVQSMAFLDDNNKEDDEEEEEDPADFFGACLNRTLEEQEGATQHGGQYRPVVVNAKTLLNLRREEVYVCRYLPSSASMVSGQAHKEADNDSATNTLLKDRHPKSLGCRFFKNMLYPDIPIALSQPAARFMCEEDFEFAALKEHKCPFSRVQQLGDYGPL